MKLKNGGKNRRKNPFWNDDYNSFSKYAVIVTALFAIYLCFIARDNVVRWVRSGFEIRQQERQMEVYRSEIEEMNRQIHLLMHDRDSLEKFAREQFHFAEPGDDVYIEE